MPQSAFTQVSHSLQASSDARVVSQMGRPHTTRKPTKTEVSKVTAMKHRWQLLMLLDPSGRRSGRFNNTAAAEKNRRMAFGSIRHCTSFPDTRFTMHDFNTESLKTYGETGHRVPQMAAPVHLHDHTNEDGDRRLRYTSANLRRIGRRTSQRSSNHGREAGRSIRWYLKAARWTQSTVCDVEWFAKQ